MAKKTTEIITEVAEYYSAKLAEHGRTPRGVDWNGEESQRLRFSQLTKVINETSGFSLNDIGCGYGALYDYLQERYCDFIYRGCDVSFDMIRAAGERWADSSGVFFAVAAEPANFADYGIASGIFNVRLGYSDAEWLEYMTEIIGIMDKTSRRGFAFNCLTSYSDADKKKDYLYYADPCAMFDFCKKHYSRQVALLHDYGLYEFTILVRKHSW